MKRWLLILAAVLALAAGLLVSIAQSPWASQRIAQRIQDEVLRATGARVEIGNLRIDWWRMSAQTGPLVFHGTEPADAPALFVARNVEIGLKIVSFLRRMVDVQTIIVDEPRVNIIVHPDGSTNIPGQGGSEKPVVEHLIDLAVGHFELRNGQLTVNDRKTPLELRAERLRAIVDYDAARQSYRGDLSVGETSAAGISAALETRFELARSRVAIESLNIKTAHSHAEGTGVVENWQSPQATFDLKGRVDVAEAGRIAKLPELRSGTVEGPVQVTYDSDRGLRAEGTMTARGLSIAAAGEKLDGIGGRAKVRWENEVATIESLDASIWDGRVQGSGEWRKKSGDYGFKGTLTGINVPREISARVTGPVRMAGNKFGILTVDTELDLQPGTGDVPVGGTVSVLYDGAKKTATFRPSSLTVGASRLNVSGAIETGLDFELRTRNLNDLMPALRLVAKEAPDSLPIDLADGLTVLRGTVRGSIEKPQVTGALNAERVRHEGRTFTNIQATGETASDHVRLTAARVNYGSASATGSGRLQLAEWKVLDSSTVAAEIDLTNGDAAELLRETTWNGKATGKLSGHIKIAGTIADPTVEGTARADQPSAAGLAVDRADVAFSWSKSLLNVRSAELRRNQDRLTFSGSYKPTGGNWRRGEIDIDGGSTGLTFPASNEFKHPFTVSGQIRGRGRIDGEKVELLSLDGTGKALAPNVGQAEFRATSRGAELELAGNANAYGANLQLASQWKLASAGLPGSGTLTLRNLTPLAIQHLATSSNTDLPFTGLAEGSASFEGRLLEPDRFAAQVRLTTLRVGPKSENVAPGIAASDLTLANDGDVVFAAGGNGVVVERARFLAKDTEIEGSGNFSARRANPLNFRLRGRLNLAVFSTFRPDLISSGVSTMDARVRGTTANPQIDGRFQLTDASFYLRGIPNGLDKVNGSILFDQSRATIETLTAETGGGAIRLGGYVGFSGEPSYQLQAQADRVRIRYPEGFSTQANAQLTLTGTSRRSLLAGTITILRASVAQTTQTAPLMSPPSSGLGGVESTNDFMKGLQFDVRVETSQSAEFATQLTKNVQGDVDLRLRGTPARPAVLGRVSITQGAVQFFGTDYRITRGEVDFVNPVRIDPQIDLDLETRVRGIIVSVNFTGPLDKLNMTYRSDPPLQSNEIIALLALGRTPTTGAQTGLGSVRGQDLFGGTGGSAVLSSAMSAPSSGALQRFFGISRIKIDPQLIGLDNTPQARLSVEQQLSRDVSITYITSLNRAQSQLVRIQWDLSREWAAIATRDENGVLSVDFVFKRSFK